MTAIEYPTITGGAARRFFDSCDQERLATSPPGLEELRLEWISTGGTSERPVRVETRPLYDLGRRAMKEVERGTFDSGVRDRFEAAYALDLHALLEDVPAEAMNHRGFWRFLSIGPFAPCTVWRQDGKNLTAAFGLPPATGRRRGGESFTLVRCLPWRLYMRAEIGGRDHVGVIGADLWWSHLFRVQIGRSIPTARSLLDEAKDLTVADQRRLAPLVTAARGRTGFDALDDDEIDDRVRREKARAAGRPAGESSVIEDPALEEEIATYV